MTKKDIVLSFDVEEHHRIEAAHGLNCSQEVKQDYAARMERVTYGLMEQLTKADTKATFYIVGRIAETHPRLVRAIAEAGHEIGSHSYEHERIHRLNPASFRDDLMRSRDALQSAAGVSVVGFRAPTFSIVRETAWAVDVLADLGFRYDSSIFPVRHDRYGVPDAPRVPFVVCGLERELIELPPTTYRLGGTNLPVAGGGYFRLFPLGFMRAGINQLAAAGSPLAMLYFHPWEFDPTQPKLPLKRLSKFRTYVGVSKSTMRLDRLLSQYRGRFARAVDVVEQLEAKRSVLPRYSLAPEATPTKAESMPVAV